MRFVAWVSVFLCCFVHALFAQEWEWQNPLPQGSDINRVQFVDSLNGWMVPIGPTLFRTRDGGKNWELLDIDLYLKRIHFITPEIGWAIARLDFNIPQDNVYHTTDGGESWELQLEETVDFAIFFLDTRKGWVSDCDRLYHTPDGGKTWITQAEPGPIPWGGTCLDQVMFKDEQRGWASAYTWGIKTSDGGDTWESDTTFANTQKIVFVDSTYGWLIKPFLIKRTDDGGQTWDNIFTFVPDNYDNQIEDIVALSRDNLVIATGEGTYGSVDGGFTWEKYNDQRFGEISFLDSLTAWAVGPEFGHDPTQYKSVDGGRTWERMIDTIVPTTAAFFEDVEFVNDKVGYVIGHGGELGPRYLLKSSDGGSAWNELLTPGSNRLHAVQFLDAQRGWLVGNNGTVFYTPDGGENWQDRSIATIADLNTVVFFDANNGWVVGGFFDLQGGAVWKTDDGGQTWLEKSPRGIKLATAGAFVDTLTGWVVTGGGSTTDVGSIWHTKDGGISWEQQLPDTPGLYFDKIGFANANVGWTIGFDNRRGGLIYLTNDGGLNWSHQIFTDLDPFVNFIPLDISVVNQKTVWLVGLLGKILLTNDGGQTWTVIRNPAGHALYAVDFISEVIGWAVGSRATILHRKDMSTAVETNSELTPGPKTFHLLPNYPNPFIEKTQISFHLIQAPAHATLTIYNILGQKVRTIEYTAPNPGPHNIVWDGRDELGNVSTSGVYLYRLQINTEWQAGKVLLSK